MSLRLQIDWRDANGRIVSGEPIFAHPFISVEVSSDDMVNWISAYVMIDTGLSRTMISPDVLNALNCVKGTSQSLSGSNGWQDFEGYRATLRFPPALDKAMTVDVLALGKPLGNSGSKGLLGMDILQLGRLALDRHGDSFFEIR